MKKKILGFLTLSFCVILNVSAEETVRLALKTNTTLRRINTVKVSNTSFIEKNTKTYELNSYNNSLKLNNKDFVTANSSEQMVKMGGANSGNRPEFDVSGLSNTMHFIGYSTISVEPLKFIISN